MNEYPVPINRAKIKKMKKNKPLPVNKENPKAKSFLSINLSRILFRVSSQYRE